MKQLEKSRTLFFVIFDATNEGKIKRLSAMPFGSGDADFTLAKATSMALSAAQFMQTGMNSASPPDQEPFRFFTWSREELAASTRFSEVPRPGVVVAVKTASADQDDIDAQGRVWALIQSLSMNQPKQLSTFLNGPDALVDAVPTFTYDVFLSHSKEDLGLAKEFKKSLEKKGLSVFMAAMDISPGALWDNEIRSALIGSHIGFILLTPNSIKAQWVICEAGALWALKKTIVPGLSYVKPEDLPEFINRHGCAKIETAKERSECVKAIAKTCAD